MNILKMSKLRTFCFALLILFPVCAFAFDWGLLTDHNFSVEKAGDADEALSYSAAFIPWFSSPLFEGDGDIYLSVGATAKYENEKWQFVPELHQFDFSFVFDTGEIRAGRMRYADPLGFTASGLFDGLSLAVDAGSGSFSAGMWYTGFLYKKTANITVTSADFDSYNAEFTFDNFSDTYFASKRILAAVGWEHPALGERVRLRVSLLNQGDVNGGDSWYHSQYLIARASIPVTPRFVLDAGGSLSVAESRVEAKENVGVSLAGQLEAGVFLPTSIQDKLSFRGTFSSGKTEDGNIEAYVPLTTVSQGGVLGAKLSGLSVLCLDYTARLHRTFSAALSNSYFVLSDKGTYKDWPAATGAEGFFLGTEVYGQLIWSPVADLRLNLGGGVFIPGDAAPNEKLKWKLELAAQLAIF